MKQLMGALDELHFQIFPPNMKACSLSEHKLISQNKIMSCTRDFSIASVFEIIGNAVLLS